MHPYASARGQEGLPLGIGEAVLDQPASQPARNTIVQEVTALVRTQVIADNTPGANLGVLQQLCRQVSGCRCKPSG